MATEIERKFLVHENRLPELTNGQHIVQGYIPTADKTVVRVRIKGQQAWLTIKGANQGASRLEFEYPIPLADAQTMLHELCTGGAIDKHRYEIEHHDLIWEIDVFAASNAGLIVAEVELENEQQAVSLPDWAAQEVTHDARYYNNQLMQKPVSSW